MLRTRSWRRPARHALGGALTILLAALLVSSRAEGHFTLDAPPSWMSQDTSGSPQKMSPCGDEGGGTATNMVTAFQPGQTITLQWTEIIAHDGWFRIALSYSNRTDLMDPPYELDSFGNSVDAGIENPPMAPVLVDGLYPHTAASITTPKMYSYQLTLPMMTCTQCTLQVIQIMLNHPNNVPYGYTYHHCADISIQAGADGGTTVVDAGPIEAGQADATTGSSSSSGAGASSGSTGSSGAGASSGSSGTAGSSSGHGSSGATT